MDEAGPLLQPGDVVERYEIVALIGEGATAEVYRARHSLLGTEHALKLLTHARPSLRDRFLQEGRVQAGLQHPHIVGVTDVLLLDGCPCLIQELVEGTTLTAFLADGPLSPTAAVALLLPVAEAVAAAHTQGVLHRDLKPDNVLVEPGPPAVAKVTDFGIAKVLAEGRQAAAARKGGTREHVAMGTPGFMAPEQWADAANVDARADVFGMAALVHTAIAGAPPFPTDGLHAMEAPLAGRFEPLDRLVPACPAALAAVVARGLAPRADDRFPDVAAFAAALRDSLDAAGADGGPPPPQGEPVSPPPPDAPAPEAGATAVPEDLPAAPPSAPSSPATAYPPPTSRAPLGAAIAAGIGVLGIGVLGVGLALRHGGGPGAGPDRVEIPATTAWHGDVWDEGRPDERPARAVELTAFAIDRTEVRTRDYLACVAEGACTPPAWQGQEEAPEWVGLTGPDQPIVGVSWTQAETWCRHHGGRLPTEEEWEAAATWGPEASTRDDKRRWPWGDAAPDCTRAVFDGCGGTTADVGTHPAGASAYGVDDLAGNAWEWTASRYPTKRRIFKKPAVRYVLRGGGFSAAEDVLRPTFRRHAPASDASPLHGFRCAWDPEGSDRG